MDLKECILEKFLYSPFLEIYLSFGILFHVLVLKYVNFSAEN